MSKISILNDVVKAVRALSALEYAAAISPKRKTNANPIPKPLCTAIVGKS